MLSTQQFILNGSNDLISNHKVKYELVVEEQYHDGFEGFPTNLASNWLPPVPGTVVVETKGKKDF